MRRPYHCIGGEGRLTTSQLFWIMQQQGHQIKLIIPIQNISDIANANRGPAHFSSFMFRYAKTGRKKAQESPHCRSKLELKSHRFGFAFGIARRLDTTIDESLLGLLIVVG